MTLSTATHSYFATLIQPSKINMLKTCYYDHRKLSFCTEEVLPDQNLFTVIVGKNGSGKSRLLKAIIENFVDVRESKVGQRSLKYVERRSDDFIIDYRAHPQNIIALSTSPFDRFPIAQQTRYIKGYEYLGLRGLWSQNLSLSFMSRTFGALLRAVTENKGQARTITDVLGYLGYEGFIEARFVTDFGKSSINTILNSDCPIDELMNLLQQRRTPFNEKLSYSLRHNLLDVNYEKLIHALRHWQVKSNKPRLDIHIDFAGVFNLGLQEEIDEQTLFLFEIGFFRLRDIGLQKISHSEKIRINDASSGEQCVVMAMLGIASHIQDGTLICIDEPEICLHPEWQERYIELLMTTFGQFSNCHFIVATHSPQVIAKLNDENCFVLDLESGNTICGRDLNKRSADFQLANVFKAPGYKNEYLSRELFHTLGIIGSGEKLGIDRLKELEKMLTLKSLLDKSDPVRSLMDILESSLKEIGAE